MKALVFSAGGARVAFSTGVIKYLLGDLQRHYDIITGVSAGAILAAFLGQYSLGKEKQAATDLVNLWKNLTTANIYRNWKPFGKLQGLCKQGIVDNSPLITLMRSNISLKKIRASGKHICVGAISMTSGKYTVFDQTSDDFIDAVIASTSFPAILPPVKIGDEYWSDGGIKVFTPTKAAIKLGADEIDIVMASPETRDKLFIGKPSIIDILKRSFDFSTDKIMSNDAEYIQMYNRLAEAGLCDKRIIALNTIRPPTNLLKDSFKLDPEQTKTLIDIGYKIAKAQFEGIQ